MIHNIGETTSALGGMSARTNSIKAISDNMNLLAINAIIKVARSGAAGHGLGVCAEEISKQSKNAKDKIAHGAKTINDVLVSSSNYTESLAVRLKEQVNHLRQYPMRPKMLLRSSSRATGDSLD
jgi:Methyl-accepting chemotaxis protein (MCP) signaling domain.